MWEVLREIGMIARSLDSIANIEFKEMHLTKGQYTYLVRICEQPGIIQEHLAQQILADRTTVARAVKKLEENGFVIRKADEQNHKIKRIFPTEKGTSIYPQLIREHCYSNEQALQGLTEKEKSEFLRLLLHARRNIESDWEVVKSGHKRNY